MKRAANAHWWDGFEDRRKKFLDQAGIRTFPRFFTLLGIPLVVELSWDSIGPLAQLVRAVDS